MKKYLKPLSNNSGMTLMEIMIVIAIIGLIMGIVGTNVMKRFDEAKVESTKVQMKQLSVILQDFKRVCGFYPTQEQGLEALVKAPAGRECKNYDPEGFVKKVPKDAWSNDFLYFSDGSKFTIKSLGGDAKEGGTGTDADISSDDIN